MKQYRNFRDVQCNAACVYVSPTLESAVVALANDRERLIERIMELDRIAPRKIRLPTGEVAVWRCPDDLIPFTTGVHFTEPV